MHIPDWTIAAAIAAIILALQHDWTTEQKIERLAKDIITARAVNPESAMKIAIKYYEEIEEF